MVINGPKNTHNMIMSKLVQDSFGQIFWYSNIFKYFGQIYSFSKIFIIFFMVIYSDLHLWSFYPAEYIWIFIRQLSMVKNIFWYTFVKKGIFVSTWFTLVHTASKVLAKWTSRLENGRILKRKGMLLDTDIYSTQKAIWL